MLSGLGKISFKETDFWKIVHLFILSFLSLCGIGLLYALSRNRSVTSEKLEEIRKILDTQKNWMKEFEDSKKKFNKIRELLDFLKKGKKEYQDINKRLSDLLNKMEKEADELIKAKEEFEEEKSGAKRN